MKKTATLLVLVLGLAIGASLHLGLNLYSPAKVLAALGGAEGTDAIIIRTLRILRTLVAICAGAALGLSGFLVQSATRNPLAEPGLLGINAGAAFCVVLGVTSWGTVGLAAMGALALAGGLSTTGFLFAVVAAAGRTAGPGTTLLAGVTLAAMLASLTQVLLLVDETALETMLFWLSGGFADRSLAVLALGLPSLAVGMIGALAISGSLDVLRLDDDSAGALGVHVTGVRMGALALGALLAAGAVAMAGPVVFLGLVAPHLARRIAPRTNSAGWIVVTVLTGAIIAVLADIVARLIVLPGEAPVGAVLALVGVPILVSLLRRKAEAAL
ncbi:iron complex transport system permease protein [Maritimibacter alkaliphilus HTCC2654]|uniref:Putative iron ABC transport system, permease protein n=1 Tax=Maritimibacter alkaliphilus HTCC2654 TaxID=314271 RepID=A3VEF6_9RHOB|nr:iron ABC transporter permease [Maritimibacter alkaliphilus]EAQ13294.1 putative iron ABC transport system, permease protein [Rhodobacterales bacterium HTCC2654] [Maritimibacter alkaliphilus HTCC2654]TYP85283.1 iron complex transport system permease protein [Maritimibacter alkaliphilus HTCC2654]